MGQRKPRRTNGTHLAYHGQNYWRRYSATQSVRLCEEAALRRVGPEQWHTLGATCSEAKAADCVRTELALGRDFPKGMFDPGQEVFLHGLVEHVEYNGRNVMILEFHADCQKYSVYLGEGPFKKVKLEHLSLRRLTRVDRKICVTLELGNFLDI